MWEKTLKKLVRRGLTCGQMAMELGCSLATIERSLKDLNLKTQRSAKWPDKLKRQRRCRNCGESDPQKFYGQKRYICATCHKLEVLEKGWRRRLEGIQFLGGKCVRCGYAEFMCALDFHHIDMTKKDPHFCNCRGWSKERLLTELLGCVLLCKNCHAAVHKGEIQLGVAESGTASVLEAEDRGFKSHHLDERGSNEDHYEKDGCA